jgi:UDP-N-acetylglucosamine--N-acetylmuramyl-(pentapeptide) pyrophosphoryl-undecaprenol N-acetylglucosamine transferase
VPGKANQWIARRATEIYTAYPHPLFENATVVGLPLRRQAIGPADARQARIQLREAMGLALDPDKPLLLVTGASQGAQSINRMMMELAQLSPSRQRLAGWQVLHLAGEQDVAALKRVYADCGIEAHVVTFCHQMGLAWRSASVAISRCGAGSVAEVWANATPTIFLPYPFHKDQHQRLNAQMLVEAGAALMLTDLVEPLANARQISGPLLSLMGNEAQRQKMVEILQADRPVDGAQAVGAWLARLM